MFNSMILIQCYYLVSSILTNLTIPTIPVDYVTGAIIEKCYKTKLKLKKKNSTIP